MSETEVQNSSIIFAAIRDYYRAFEQRSRWIREDLLIVGELDQYEKLLREEWELQFDRVADELGDDQLVEKAKRTAAQQIYAWVEQSYPSVSLTPEFIQRLQQVIEPDADAAVAFAPPP